MEREIPNLHFKPNKLTYYTTYSYYFDKNLKLLEWSRAIWINIDNISKRMLDKKEIAEC